MIHFYHQSHPVCGNLLRRPSQMNTSHIQSGAYPAEYCHGPLAFQKRAPSNVNHIHPLSPSTSGPEQGVDLDHFQAGSSLLSALVISPTFCG